MENATESANAEIHPSEKSSPDYDLLARMIVRDGKPFKESAIASGYSTSVACSGLKRLLRDSGPVAEAYNREISRFARLTDLKPLAVRRLHAEITDYTSSQGIKAIELAGRFKETDWWVKGNDVQIGIFATLGDGQVDPAMNSIASYADSTDETEP